MVLTTFALQLESGAYLRLMRVISPQALHQILFVGLPERFFGMRDMKELQFTEVNARYQLLVVILHLHGRLDLDTSRIHQSEEDL